jgi:hypothetical protein
LKKYAKVDIRIDLNPLPNQFEVNVSNGTQEDESELLSFTIHLGLERISSKDDESPWIEPPDIAYLSPSAALVKSSACIIRATSLFGLVRFAVK